MKLKQRIIKNIIVKSEREKGANSNTFSLKHDGVCFFTILIRNTQALKQLSNYPISFAYYVVQKVDSICFCFNTYQM